MSPVLYMSLEHFRSAPINHLMFCTVRESRTSENRTENKVKQKVNIRGYPGISLGRFVHCQYRNQSVSTPCTREKQSVSVTPFLGRCRLRVDIPFSLFFFDKPSDTVLLFFVQRVQLAIDYPMGLRVRGVSCALLRGLSFFVEDSVVFL